MGSCPLLMLQMFAWTKQKDMRKERMTLPNNNIYCIHECDVNSCTTYTSTLVLWSFQETRLRNRQNGIRKLVNITQGPGISRALADQVQPINLLAVSSWSMHISFDDKSMCISPRETSCQKSVFLNTVFFNIFHWWRTLARSDSIGLEPTPPNHWAHCNYPCCPPCYSDIPQDRVVIHWAMDCVCKWPSV